VSITTNARNVIVNISSTAEAGSKEQDPAYVYRLTPRRTLWALGPFGTVRAVRAFRPIGALGSIATLRPLGPIASFGALRAVRPLGSRWSLDFRGRPLVGNLAEHGSHVACGDRARGHQGQDDS
jgi:hypothetical protein